MLFVKDKLQIQDYKKLPENEPYQLIDGELIMSPEPSPEHQIIAANIFESLRNFAKTLGLVLFSPVDIYLGNHDAYQPDLIFILKDRKKIIKKDGIYGPPDLVVEILSPSTAYYDIRKKYKIYEEFGIKEYWIVDPEMENVEIYTNNKQKFELVSKIEKKGQAKSILLNGFNMSLADIFTK